jgi:hypothetical protein
MEKMSASMWQYTPNNSPLPLPKSSFIVSNNEFLSLDLPLIGEHEISIESIKEAIGNAMVGQEKVSQHLTNHAAPAMNDRRPLLLLGELANPFQLARLGLGIIPVVTVRIRDLCRTYADSLDPRMIQPGVHHITMARSKGWWEKTHLGFVTVQQMKTMIQWLGNGGSTDWRPVKPNEGEIMLEFDSELRHPTMESLSMEGNIEICTDVEPDQNGPKFEVSQVIVPVHTRHGCYDSRGKIIRCYHVGQRDFHTNYFRKGSFMKWQDILTTL